MVSRLAGYRTATRLYPTSSCVYAQRDDRGYPLSRRGYDAACPDAFWHRPCRGAERARHSRHC